MQIVYLRFWSNETLSHMSWMTAFIDLFQYFIHHWPFFDSFIEDFIPQPFSRFIHGKADITFMYTMYVPLFCLPFLQLLFLYSFRSTINFFFHLKSIIVWLTLVCSSHLLHFYSKSSSIVFTFIFVFSMEKIKLNLIKWSNRLKR